MSSPKHCGKLTLAHRPVGGSDSIRAQSLALRKAKASSQPPLRNHRRQRRPLIFTNTGGAQSCRNPPLAQPTPGHGPRPRGGKGTFIDIAKRNHAIGE